MRFTERDSVMLGESKVAILPWCCKLHQTASAQHRPSPAHHESTSLYSALPSEPPNLTNTTKHGVLARCRRPADRRRRGGRHGPDRSRSVSCRRNSRRISRKELFSRSTARGKLGAWSFGCSEVGDVGIEIGRSWSDLVVYVFLPFPTSIISYSSAHHTCFSKEAC